MNAITDFLHGPARFTAAVLLVVALGLLTGCGAKHTLGDRVIYSPDAEEQQEVPEKTDEKEEDDSRFEPTEAEPQTEQFVEAKGTSIGGEDWVAEIYEEESGLRLISPFDEDATYAMVRAATFLQGLRLAEEDFDRRRFTTTHAYKAWHGDNEGGFALAMKALTKGFGKDARYRLRVSVESLEEGGSRVKVHQYREVMEEEDYENVGDWVEADEPDPGITRKYLEGVRRAIGDVAD